MQFESLSFTCIIDSELFYLRDLLIFNQYFCILLRRLLKDVHIFTYLGSYHLVGVVRYDKVYLRRIPHFFSLICTGVA